MISRMNVVLAGLLALVLGLAALVRVDYSKPNLEVLPDMKYTPAWSAYANNPNFSNGRTLQAPVVGTIARGDLPLHFEATKEDALRAGEELRNPLSSTADTEQGPASEAEKERLKASLQRGGEVYRVYCIACHGAAAAGDGPVSQRGFPPPPSLLTGKSRQMKDGQLFHILTYGQGSMSSFAPQLSHARRWDVIHYIRDLQSKAPVSSETTSHE
jgi:mono/diheme cytochrome c family protein